MQNPNLKPHHTENGFKNVDPDFQDKNFYDVLKWQVSRLFKKLPSLNPADYKVEVVEGDFKSINQNENKLSVTWIGHATTLIQIDGVNILTDPIWSERCSPVSFAGPKRFTKPGIKIENLPRIDIVIISHNHYDHLDLETLKILENKFHPNFFVGLKNKKLLLSNGLKNVFELDWWDNQKINNVEINFTPTQHFSARGLFDRNETLWGSYIIKGKTNTVYFAGDTAYFNGFLEIGKKFPNIDIAILPIGAYEPHDFMKPVHMNPEESMNAFQDLGAKFFVPMHYMTFVLSDEALDEPLLKTKNLFIEKNIPNERLIDLKIGQSKFFP